MQKFQADYIYPISSDPIPKGIIVIDEKGIVQEITSSGTYSSADINQYEGILCPGFINTHCHLELSHLQQTIAVGMGLPRFLRSIGQYKQSYSSAYITEAINQSEKSMLANGIVAVGDISNGDTSFAQKSLGNLRYHTFIELIGLHPATAAEKIALGQQLLKQVPTTGQSSASLSPHAPYTASAQLLAQIDHSNTLNNTPQSIHNQEHPDENAMFQNGTGAFYDLYHHLGLPIKEMFTPTNTNSLAYTLSHLSPHNKTLLVHNTYTSAAEIQQSQALNPHLYWCFCPNANLFIQGELPNFKAFLPVSSNITLGTDSLASNWQLCIFSEIKTISQHAPYIPLATLLQWASLNGANFLGFNDTLGSLEVGKKPGLNLIKYLKPDYSLSPLSRLKKIL